MNTDIPDFNIETFDPARDLCIEASAGTGKTFTINLIVKKLVAAGTPIEKILIVTYTEKACGELKNRIRKTLTEAGHDEKFQAAAQAVDNAPIFTFHAFCKHTLEEFAFNANAAYKLGMVSNDERDAFVDRWIRDDLAKDRAFLDTEELVSEVKKFTGKISKALSLYYEGIRAEEVITVDNATTACTDLDSAYTFYLPQLYKKWQQYKASQKVQSYDDMIRSVREAVLAEDATLKNQLRKKYTYAIIDEFQDTNQRQWDIFSTLFMDTAGEQKTHSLFVVGDPKQSIYSFQGANVNVYKHALDEIVKNDGHKCRLSTNWRSTKPMIVACNALFAQDFFSPDNCTFSPSQASGKIHPALLYDNDSSSWKETPPLHIALNTPQQLMDETYFAQIAVAKIISWCSFVPNAVPKCEQPLASEKNYTRLLIWDKNKQYDAEKPEGCYRPVTFKDFAVLASTKSEMVPIEQQLSKNGVPYVRYKDNNLFVGAEAKQWIALFSAINASDFTGANVRILHECLFSDFFRQNSAIPAKDYFVIIEDENCKNPENNSTFDKLKAWKLLAQKQKWAQLFEHIYSTSLIESRFSTLDGLNRLTKLRQIGDYALDYLYTHRCDLVEVTNHLSRLVKNSAQVEEDENIIAKGTDFNSVQIMTIHASKGLEFPIVISVAGYKNPLGISTPFTYNDSQGKLHLTFSETQKPLRKKEDQDEQQRKYYVGYTRAASIMVLPQYAKWESKDTWNFLHNSFTRFVAEQKNLYDELTLPDPNPSKADVSVILATLGATAESDDASKATQEAHFAQVTTAIVRSRLQQHSYTSLSQEKKDSGAASTATFSVDDAENNIDSDGQFAQQLDLAHFDRAPKRIFTADDYDTDAPVIDTQRYPKGKNLGKALHKAFEDADFQAIGALKTEAEALQSTPLAALITTSFAMYAIDTTQADSAPNQTSQTTAQILWHTLHAALPKIRGAHRTQDTFSLGQLSARDCKAELEFALRPEDGALRAFCKGFIDLVCMPPVREDEEPIYAVLDWKSDIMAAEDFSSAAALQAKVDHHYSIQRTLYSYCLVRWLAAFYPQKTLSEIFASHFGGIYYVFARGCHAGTANGIYAQTWNSWEDLENAFNEIRDEKITASAEKEQN